MWLGDVFDYFSDDPERERVAVLLGSPGRIEYALPLINYAGDPHAFKVKRSEIAAIEEITAMRAVGLAHSHLEGDSLVPSLEDLVFLPDGWLGVVIHLPTKTITHFKG